MNRGFTIFFAMLAASLALAIGLAIYDLTAREIDLSSSATQSQYALYAADTGAECALYWDAKCTNGSCKNGSAFATSTNFRGVPASSGLPCATQDITAVTSAIPTLDASRYPGCSSTVPWCVAALSNQATTTFTLNFSSQTAQPYCAVVQVGKYTDANNILYTTVISRGYNTCVGGPVRFERTLQVNY